MAQTRGKVLRRVCLSVPVGAFGLCIVLFLGLLAPGARAFCGNMLSINGVVYSRVQMRPGGSAGRAMTEADLGIKFGEVAKNRSTIEPMKPAETFGTENQCGPFENYSTDLPVGTPLYAMAGYNPEFRLIAPLPDNTFELFQSDYVPGATRGLDLFDIDGKVDHIELMNRRETVLAVIADPKLVSNLSRQMVEAPLSDGQAKSMRNPVFLVYHLDDGTVATDSWYADTGEPGSGIQPPDAFSEILRAALADQRPTPERDRIPGATPIAR